MPRATENDKLPYEDFRAPIKERMPSPYRWQDPPDPIGKRVRDLETYYNYGKWRNRLTWIVAIYLTWKFWFHYF